MSNWKKKKKPEEKLINDGDGAPLSCCDLNIIKLLDWFWVKLHVNKGACVTAFVKTPKTLKEALFMFYDAFMCSNHIREIAHSNVG